MELPPIATAPALAHRMPRLWPVLPGFADPAYLCYRRHSFEQRNFERHGWDLGVLHPPIATALFYADVLLLPVHWAWDPCRHYECTPGLCLPGDPTPLYWYRLFHK